MSFLLSLQWEQISISSPMPAVPYHPPRDIHGMGQGEPRAALQAAGLEALGGTEIGHAVLETPLFSPCGLPPTHCLLLVGSPDAMGSVVPMSPACRALICSSHFFFGQLTFKIKSKQQQREKNGVEQTQFAPGFVS